MIDILNRGSPIVLLALGQALVIATGGVDLSVGAVMAVCGAVAACLIAQPDYSPLTGFVDPHGSLIIIVGISLLVAVIAGLWNGVLVVGLGLQPIVATLVLMVAGRGLAQLFAGGQIVTFNHPGFSAIGRGTFIGLPMPVIIAIATAIVFGVLTRLTSLGLFLESSGNSPKAARMAGVPTARVTIIAYAACGLCAGIAGMIQTADINGGDANNLGLYSELDAILAVSLGGTALAGGRFSLAGAIAGAILIQTLMTTINMTTIGGRAVDPAWTLVIKGAVVIAVCLLQSEAARVAIRNAFKRKSAGGVA
ncbi:MAG: ABC transporter permease [Tepidisphaeraceae bacterium]